MGPQVRPDHRLKGQTHNAFSLPRQEPDYPGEEPCDDRQRHNRPDIRGNQPSDCRQFRQFLRTEPQRRRRAVSTARMACPRGRGHALSQECHEAELPRAHVGRSGSGDGYLLDSPTLPGLDQHWPLAGPQKPSRLRGNEPYPKGRARSRDVLDDP